MDVNHLVVEKTRNTLETRRLLYKILQEVPEIDLYDISFLSKDTAFNITFTLYPSGFQMIGDRDTLGTVHKTEEVHPFPIIIAKITKNIQESLSLADTDIKQIYPPVSEIAAAAASLAEAEAEPCSPSGPNCYTLFPSLPPVSSNLTTDTDDMKEEFTRLYIDQSTDKIRNLEEFRARLMGFVSFFNETTETTEEGGSIFPDLIGPNPTSRIHIEEVDMSNYQFIHYGDARETERKTEKTRNAPLEGAGQSLEVKASYFKVISRTYGLFVFPPGVKRYWPSHFKLSLGEDDKDEEDPDEISVEVGAEGIDQTRLATSRYREMKDNLMRGLRSGNLRSDDGESYNLGILSPKYARAIQRIQASAGQVMCYSQFRTLEGIGVFKSVLNEYGYQEYKVGMDGDTITTNQDGRCMLRLQITNDKQVPSNVWITIEATQEETGVEEAMAAEEETYISHLT